MSLFDAGGRQVYSQGRLVDTGSSVAANGVYWLRVRGEEGDVTRKVVVIR
jgi:hypothetical protein